MDHKYDLNNDVDDSLFLANSKPNYNSYNKPSSAVQEFEQKKLMLLEKKNKLEASCLQSTQNSLALINESEQVGSRAGEDLLIQREKLGRIENGLDTISGVSRQSQKNLNSMNAGVFSFMFNGLKTMFKKDKPQQTTSQPKLPTSQSANNFKDNQLNNTLQKQRSNSTQYDNNKFVNKHETIFEETTVKRSNKNDFDSKLDDHLIDIQSGIGRLKDLALGLNKEISEQNEQLDVISGKADKMDYTIKLQNKQMLKHLGN